MHRSASEGFNSQYNIACDSNKALCKTITEPNIPLADRKRLHTFSIPTFNLQCPNIREIMESFLSFGDAESFDRWKWNVNTDTPLLTMKNVEDCSKRSFLNRKRISLTGSLQKGDIMMADFKCSIENQKQNSISTVTDKDGVVNKENDSDHAEALALNEQKGPESSMEQKESFLNETAVSGNYTKNDNVIFERMHEIMESTKTLSVGIVSDIQENSMNRKSMSEENIFRTDVTAKELTKSTTLKCDTNFSTSDSDLLSCDYDWSNEENDGSIDIDLYNREILNSYNISTLESDDIEHQLHYDLTNTLASIDPNPMINAEEKDYELFPIPNSSKSFENIQTQIYFQPDYQEPIDSNLCFHDEQEISLDPYVLWVNSLYFNSDEHFITAGNAEDTEDDISTETMIYFSKLQDLRSDKTETVTNEMDSVLYQLNNDVCKTSQYNKNETFCNKDSSSSGDDNSQSKLSFRSTSTNDSSIYDETCFGRSDVFHPLLTNSEQKMVGLESAYSNNSIFKNSIEESFGPNGATNSEATIDGHNISRDDNKDSGQLFDCEEKTSGVHNDLAELHYYTSTSQSVKEQLSCIADLAKTCTININDFLQGTSIDRAKCEHSISSDVYQYESENSEKDDNLEKLLEAHDLKVQEQLSYISGIVQLCNDNITELLESLQRSRGCMNNAIQIPSSKIDFIKDEDLKGKSLEPNSDLDACDKYIQTESFRNNVNLCPNLSKNNTSNGTNDINRIWEHVKMFRTNNRSLKQQKKLTMTNIKKKYKCKDYINTVNRQLGEENGVVFENTEDMKLETMKYLHLAEMEYKKNKETLITDKNRGKLRNFLFVNTTNIDSLKMQHKRKIQRLTIEFNQKKVKADKELKKKFQDLKCKMYVEACKMETKLKQQRQSLDIWLTNQDLSLSKAVLNMSLTDEFKAVNDII